MVSTSSFNLVSIAKWETHWLVFTVLVTLLFATCRRRRQCFFGFSSRYYLQFMSFQIWATGSFVWLAGQKTECNHPARILISRSVLPDSQIIRMRWQFRSPPEVSFLMVSKKSDVVSVRVSQKLISLSFWSFVIFNFFEKNPWP